MTDEVASLVLQDNYDQTLALTLAQATSVADLDAGERMIERLERTGKLIRGVEGLPSAEEFRTLRAAKLGLTRPEQAKLLAYAKIDLFDSLVASSAPDDPHFEQPLAAYFPPHLAKYENEMRRHRLRREIIATYLADDLVNMGGPTFVDRVHETVRADPVTIACAFEAGRRIYGLDEVSGRINALDNKAPASLQTELHLVITLTLKRLTNYLTRRGGIGQTRTIAQTIAFYRPAVDAQRDVIWGALTPLENERALARRDDFVVQGAPRDLAAEVAELIPLTNALDVADLASRREWPPGAATFVHRAIGGHFRLDHLAAAAGALVLDHHWDRLALRRALEDLFARQSALAEAAIAQMERPPAALSADWAKEAVARWAASVGAPADSAVRTIAELESQGPWTFAKLMIAAAEMHALAAATCV
jgi:glutamate dehydrogenase